MAGRKPTISDEEILEIIDSHPDPFIVASDLVDDLDMTRQGVLMRLDKLYNSGHLDKKSTGSLNVYWIAEGD